MLFIFSYPLFLFSIFLEFPLILKFPLWDFNIFLVTLYLSCHKNAYTKKSNIQHDA
jgi:hypothetical protein